MRNIACKQNNILYNIGNRASFLVSLYIRQTTNCSWHHFEPLEISYSSQNRNSDRSLVCFNCRYARFAGVMLHCWLCKCMLVTTSEFMTCRSQPAAWWTPSQTEFKTHRRRPQPEDHPRHICFDVSWNWHNPNPNPETGLDWETWFSFGPDYLFIYICVYVCPLPIREKVQVAYQFTFTSIIVI